MNEFKIEDFEIDLKKPLGKGGFGSVYKATKKDSNEVYAIKRISIENINERESYWIAFYESNNRKFGYNIEEGGHAYRTFSDETRKKISDALKGRTKTSEHKEKLRQANLGRKQTLL